jgi:hypothetical protein
MVVSHALPSLEDPSITAFACSGISEPSSASLFPAKIPWRRRCSVASWGLSGRDSAVRMAARVLIGFKLPQSFGYVPSVDSVESVKVE